MANPITLTRNQLREFLPNARAVKAFEELLLTSGTTTPADITELTRITEELTMSLGTTTAQAELALDLLGKIEQHLSVLTCAPVSTSVISTQKKESRIMLLEGNDIGEEIYVPTPIKIRQDYVEDSGVVGLTSGVITNVASVDLPTGDWEVYGYALIDTDPATALSLAGAGASTSASSFGSPGEYWEWAFGSTIPNPQFSFPIPTLRFDITVPTTIYLNAIASFTSTCTATVKLSARRIYNGN